MRKKIMKAAFVAAFAAVAGYGIYTNQRTETMSDLMLANVEALAGGESGREDCTSASDICSELVIYPDGDYGEDILLGYTKKPGWL
ncbi:NVEALA domain-containing protein [Bacteroides muris (ex Afrizal et al. 2022)]|uniref:Transporter n=1 Tax=Bacteroides muris (ex Afrizal et al. 2022) TaxID=2516960 RepID=A0A4S2AYA4_9BACE|nr:NVEALA domain-containing protein [Bacteroides muris (ex Afrizal et al. 2022)]TGY06471.1 transporter [Bacteroides muris (ex Afrizal et al. 2022)]